MARTPLDQERGRLGVKRAPRSTLFAMFNVGGGELLVILLLALIVLGPQKLPGAMRPGGRVMGEVRRISSGFQQELKQALDDTDVEPVDLPARRRESVPLASAVAEAPPSEPPTGTATKTRTTTTTTSRLSCRPRRSPPPTSTTTSTVAPAMAAALDEIVTPLPGPASPEPRRRRRDRQRPGDQRAAS